MPDLETNLRETLERHAQSISTESGGGDALVSSVMQRRRRRTATIYAATLGPAAVVASFALRAGSDGSDVQTAPGTTPAPTSSRPTPPVESTLPPPRTTPEPTPSSIWPPSEPLAMGGAASCVEEYSPTNLTNRAFAFDGTVIAIRGATDPDLAGWMVEVDFEVNEWFRAGDDEPTATVDMFDPGTLTSVDQTGLDTWTVGSRLLITGEPRWGGDPLDNAVAWYCGFSRTYNPDVAATWREVLAANQDARP